MRDRNKWLYCIILIVTLSGTLACDFLASVLPNAPATPTPITPQATATPTHLPPLPTITPSPTPSIPLPAPRLAYRSPGTHESMALDAPIELVFDQPMDQASVQNALSIEPKVEGVIKLDQPAYAAVHTL